MPSIVDGLPWGQRVIVALLGVAAGTLVVLEGLTAPSVPTVVGLVACGALPVAALFLPSVRPAFVAAVAGASATFSVVCTQLPDRPENTFGIVELAALSWLLVRVILQHPPLRAAWQAAALFIAVVFLPLRLEKLRNDYKGAMIVALAVGLAFLALLAMYLRLHDRRRADSDELARQTQRLEYARDLHDFVAHHVTAIVAQTKAVRYTAAAGHRPEPQTVDAMLIGIEQAGSQALASMRSMIAVLRDDAPTPIRPQRTLGEILSAAVGQFPAVAVRASASLDNRIADRPLPQPTLDAAYHVVQESLANVLRHAADVSRVEVGARIRPDNTNLVEITVTDDGAPATPAVPSGGGFGLVGLAERVQAAGGRLSAGPTDSGWRVAAVLPMSMPERAGGAASPGMRPSSQ